jgi:heptosyltransferase-2
MKILIVQTSFLGDTILSTPVVAGIRQIYPEAELWMMTTPLSTQLVSRDPLLTGVIAYDKRGEDAGLKGLVAMAERIRSMDFDLVYALHRSYRTSVLLWLAKIPMRIGFRKAGFPFLYHQTFDRNPKDHDVIRNLSILKGWDEPSSFETDMRLYAPSAQELSDALRALLPDAPYAVLVPGSAWETKRWHAEGFRKTAVFLKDRGFRVVLLGGPEDAVTNHQVADGLDVIDLAGKTSISDAMYVVSQAKLVVCNDSMSLHMASAFKIPTVAVFCATSPALGYGPWKNNARVVEKQLACKPCGRHGGRRCPNGTEACMKDVDFDEVVSAINAVLETGDPVAGMPGG